MRYCNIPRKARLLLPAMLLWTAAAAGCAGEGRQPPESAGWEAAPERYYDQGSALRGGDHLAVPGAYPSIQEAIAAAGAGDVIVVAPGTYFENINFSGKEIILRGSDPGDPAVVASTIIDGGGSGSTVIFAGGEGAGAMLVGFTITGGGGTVLPEHFGCYGGGILVINGSAPVIEGNVIAGNETAAGAVPVAGYGGGIAVLGASPTLSANTVTGNRACVSGGGIYVLGGAPALLHNTVSGNESGRGGGIAVGHGAAPVIYGNRITENRAAEGGAVAVLPGSAPLVEKNLISGNYAAIYGGGLSMWEAAPLIMGNTVEANEARVAGGGLCISRRAEIDPAVRRHNTLRRNRPDGIYYQPDE